MSARIAALALSGLALAGAQAVAGADLSRRPPARSTEQPLPRDGDVAIQEELESARRAGTPAAYDRFLARHPGHKLTRTARRERAALVRAR
ncbi:MAG TPA: hypothetical protein VMS43_03305 [Allosphingosinicella sp.]|nr:hypothetical protein [Allosphingosinicella sp.]